MNVTSIPELIDLQRRFFKTGQTRNIDFRIQQLKKLRQLLISNESEMLNALQKDLSKPAFEAYAGDIGIPLQEIDHALCHLFSWTRPKIVPSPLVLFPSQSRIYYEPRGVVLVLSPWNYPFQLTVVPLIGAIAAGNCVVLKPSELAPASSELMAKMIGENYPKEYIAVVQGGKEVAEELLKTRVDYIFFTGGTAVGKIVARAAAENLIPYTLELGGKSPCIVDEEVNMDVAARRVVWGKFYNAGQSCVAPDYLLLHSRIKDPFIEKMKQNVLQFFGKDPSASPDYARIVNEKHFDRLQNLLSQGKIILGGHTDRLRLYIEPTIMDEVSMEGEIMTEEIFGPILPIVEYSDISEAIAFIEKHPDPLSFYVFSSNSKNRERLLREIRFGGGCINNTLVHLSNPYLPFGGIGTSGIGAYHGRYSFLTFSHQKGIVHSSTRIDPKIIYQPYEKKLRLLRLLIE